MLNWSEISTVLLDMDGTILDLHFDTHFWLEHLPMRYSEKTGISLEQAKEKLVTHGWEPGAVLSMVEGAGADSV